MSPGGMVEFPDAEPPYGEFIKKAGTQIGNSSATS